jgi:hypothetical protein
MLRRHLLLSLLAAGVLATAALANSHSQYVFTSFDFPGALNTSTHGVNNAGTIVGYFNHVPGESTVTF